MRCWVGSADMRISKKENLQMLAILVKLSVVHFKQQWLCSHKGMIFSSLLPRHEHPALAMGTSWGWLMPPPQLGNADTEKV